MYQFTFQPLHFYFRDVVVVSDLNKTFGGSTDLAKRRHGSADLHDPIHPPPRYHNETWNQDGRNKLKLIRNYETST